MAQKPRNWYDMTDSERREWNRQNQALEDAEYDREQSERRAERATDDARRAQEAARSARYEYEEVTDAMRGEISDLEEQLIDVRMQRDKLLAALKTLLADMEAEYRDRHGNVDYNEIKKARTAIREVEPDF